MHVDWSYWEGTCMRRELDVFLSEVYGLAQGPSAELPTSLGKIDLHNCADFDGFRFLTSGSLMLTWLSDETRMLAVGATRLSRVELTFSSVERLLVLARDPDMPKSEDKTLDSFVVEHLSPGSCRLRFTFWGGAEIDVAAAGVRLTVEYDA